ncbi:MAG: hypothetical protein HY978_01415 [Candidatus Liptonbacteria bacterium]|nr:hypothetical protein [Candidatus Liptonbacteria bacterium]
MAEANTQNLVMIEEIRDNTIILSGGLRQILLVGGMNFALKSEVEQNVITQSYQEFLNGLDFTVQTVIHSRKINIEKYLTKLEKRRVDEPSSLLQNQMLEYQSFIRGFVHDNPIMRKLFLVVVPYDTVTLPSRESAGKFLPFLKSKDTSAAAAQTSAADEAEFQKNLTQLGQRVEQVMEGLRAVGLEVKLLGNEQLVELFYNFYNPETIEKEGVRVPGVETLEAAGQK